VYNNITWDDLISARRSLRGDFTFENDDTNDYNGDMIPNEIKVDKATRIKWDYDRHLKMLQFVVCYDEPSNMDLIWRGLRGRPVFPYSEVMQLIRRQMEKLGFNPDPF
jgi:hypothetical protein